MVSKTRASNTDKHPGRVDAPGTRRTRAQLEAAKEEAAEKKKREEEEKIAKTHRVANLEDRMALRDEQAEAERVKKPTKASSQRSQPLRRTYASQDVMEVDKEQRRPKRAVVSDSEEDTQGAKDKKTDLGSELTELEPEEEEPPTKKKKLIPSARQAILAVRQQSSTASVAEVVDSENKVRKYGGKDAPPKNKRAAKDTETSAPSGLIRKWDSAISSWDSGTQKGPISSRTTATSTTAISKSKDKSKRKAKAMQIVDEAQSDDHTDKEPRGKKRVIEVNTSKFLSDDEDAERVAAMSSPVKGPGKRLTHNDIIDIEATPMPKVQRKTSQSSVAVEDVIMVDDTPVPKRKASSGLHAVNVKKEPVPVKIEQSSKVSKGRTKRVFKNSDLPVGYDNNGRWRGQFIPTASEHSGALKNPWGWSDRRNLKVTQILWNEVYVDVPKGVLVIRYTVQVLEDPVVGVLSQRLCEWRSGFGSTSLSMLESLFKTEKIYTMEERIDFAKYMLCDGRFLWRDTYSEDPEEWQGLFQSSFVLRTLAFHHTAIRGALAIKQLDSMAANDSGDESEKEAEDTDVTPPPYGAIGLAAAAVERALCLWAEGCMLINEEGEAVIDKTINVDSGRTSTKSTAFDEKQWGQATRDYVISALDLSAVKLKKIVDGSRVFAKHSVGSGGSGSSRKDSRGSEDEHRNHRALLVDREED